MLHLDRNERGTASKGSFGHIGRLGPLGGLILPLTRALRAARVLRHLPAQASHLDFGCGDGYLLSRSPCRDRYGYDPLLGDSPADLRAFPDASFDRVTMLSVLEYLEDPLPALRELHRLLRPDGRLILTTPKRLTVRLRELYARDIDEDRKRYYDGAAVEALAAGLFTVLGRETFNLGTNQLFVLEPTG